MFETSLELKKQVPKQEILIKFQKYSILKHIYNSKEPSIIIIRLKKNEVYRRQHT